MPVLKPTDFEATIDTILVNDNAQDITSTAVNTVTVDYGGFVGDIHHGETRQSCVRVRSQYPQDTEIRNTRQISALSVEQLEQIRDALGIETLKPEWLGANLTLEGIPDFTKVPPGSRLIAANGTSIVVDMENEPCRYPADIIEQHYPDKGRLFPKKAMGKRGVTLWVERTGILSVGDALRLHTPPPVTWNY